jgi:two-component system sensor histidine kinase/response regulator
LADGPVTAAAQAVPGELPVIAGLDTAAGLRRVRGNTAFYLSLLRKFARNHGSLMDTLQSDLQQGNLEAARRDAHTLKGLSASIGMDAISAQAALLEQQIKLERDSSALLQSLQALITSFVQQLVQQLPAAVPVAAALADPAELGRVCSRLGALLADDNLEAVEWLARHEALLAQALDHSYAPIADAVRRFDCARALSLLRIAAQSTGIALSNTTEAS